MTKLRKKGMLLAVAAVCALALTVPALAFADPPTPSTTTTGGDGSSSTVLKLQTDTSVFVTNDSTNVSNMKVLVPVAINFVAKGDGTILGPSDAKLKNYSQFPVHVDNILVTPETGVTIDGSSATNLTQADHVQLLMQSGSQIINLGDFVQGGNGSLTAGNWNIGSGGTNPGELALSFPNGHLGAYGTAISAFNETTLGTITWTVAAGNAATS